MGQRAAHASNVPSTTTHHPDQKVSRNPSWSVRGAYARFELAFGCPYRGLLSCSVYD
jgi:hypothetical protein